MAKKRANARNQRTRWGKTLLVVSMAALLTEFLLLFRPLWDMAERLKEGLVGVVPAAGMCLLNATHALAFHQVDNLWLVSHILVSSCAMTGLIAGVTLLRTKSPRKLFFELALAPESQGRETINNGSR